MRRGTAVIFVAAVTALGLLPGFPAHASVHPAAALAQRVPNLPGTTDSYCSRSLQNCTAIIERGGEVFLIYFTNETKTDSVKICVRSPAGKQKCRKTSDFTEADGYRGGGLVASRDFPFKAPGRYGATFRVEGKRIGPRFHFVLS